MYTIVADVGVPEHLLHRPNVEPSSIKMCRKRMPEGVWTYSLGDAGLARRLGDGLLDNGVVDVKPASEVPTADRCRWSELS